MVFVSFLVIPVWAQKLWTEHVDRSVLVVLEDSATMGGQVEFLIQVFLTSYMLRKTRRKQDSVCTAVSLWSLT